MFHGAGAYRLQQERGRHRDSAAENDERRIQQVYQNRDARPQVTARLFQDLDGELVSQARGFQDGLRVDLIDMQVLLLRHDCRGIL